METESQTLVSYVTWVLGTEVSSGGAITLARQLGAILHLSPAFSFSVLF